MRAASLGAVGFVLGRVAHVAAWGVAPGLAVPANCVMTGMTGMTGGQMGHGARPVVDCATAMVRSGMGRPVFAAAVMVGAHVEATAVTAALLAYWVTSWMHNDLANSPRPGGDQISSLVV